MLDRKIINWRWYDDANTFRVFIHLLLCAVFVDELPYHDTVLKRGQWLTTRKQLSSELGISEQAVRTALKHLESTGEITVKLTNNKSLITVENYEFYQDKDTVANQRTTNDQPATNQLNNNANNANNINTINSICGTDAPQPTQRQKILDKWNALPVKSVKSINPNTKRHNMLNARVKEYGLDAVLEAIDNIPKSPHLLGNNSSGWIITFDWFVKPNNFIKVLEGNYIKDTVESKQNVFSDDIYDLIDE